MEKLRKAVYGCPIIDNHAHNLLLPTELRARPLLAATTEAGGAALQHTKSTLAHLRAVKQLSEILKCEPTWEAVEKRLAEERACSNDAWAKRCFEGIATVLIDDGLDKDTVHPYQWHDRLTPFKCKRIVRIEIIAQNILVGMKGEASRDPAQAAVKRFVTAIEDALADPDVVGFKSIICYRTGLAMPTWEGLTGPGVIFNELARHITTGDTASLKRLQHHRLNPLFVHMTCRTIERSANKKPFQFHTGLGDNDIQLSVASAACMQPLIKSYPAVPFVLLHASYPFTQEAGYLASVYENCYLDIGEVFPMVSQEGQERVIREALELCPTEKLCWSTDGHWFPETYLLAVIQVREGLAKVLGEYVATKALTVSQAVKSAQDILFETSHRLYMLDLPSLEKTAAALTSMDVVRISTIDDDTAALELFLKRNPEVRWIHLLYLDYTAMRRGRVVPISRARKMLETKSFVGLQWGILRQTQDDDMAPGTTTEGEWCMKPCLDSIRPTADPTMASVMCEIRFKDGWDLSHDPRTVLHRTLDQASAMGREFTVGSEIEVVFMSPHFDQTNSKTSYKPADLCAGHAWSAAASHESAKARTLVASVLQALESCGIEVEQWHAEAAKSQYEFILAPLPAMQAADALVAARAAIAVAADEHGLRATYVPKPYAEGFGTGAHAHISISPEDKHEAFYAGVLKHMRGLTALAMPGPVSYERQGDGRWSGGTWVCWGDQNRECCLRRVGGSHWECKVVDGLANVYLVLAGLIGCGLQGIRDGERLTAGSVDVQPDSLTDEERKEMGITQKLPDGLETALEALQDDEVLAKVLGKDAVETFVAVKKHEISKLADFVYDEVRDWYIERY